MHRSVRFLLGLATGALGFASVSAASIPGVVAPRFTHPGAGQTVYFVLTDRFANGRADNDTGGFGGGPEENGFDPARIGYFHGGDFAGLTARLDYIKSLGVTAVWITPPFQNKPVQNGSAAYHGYWVTDFLKVDPHLGANDEYREFIRQAHARGLKVYMDIIVNHTADVIHYPDYKTDYLDRKTHPLRDAEGRPLDERVLAYNGLGGDAWPALSAERSFPFAPLVPAAERNVKNPAWLNDVTLYHNRGNSTFRDESSLYGDFSGLDDTLTEHPRVVRGMIELFSSWVRDYDLDGFRIDTARHVNAEFWQAFAPAIRAAARAAGHPDFVQFGEVANETLDVPLLSEFSTHLPLDTTLDFGFFAAARNFVSRGGTAAALTDLFQRDDYYTDHDGNVHTTTTFLGNHDAGRFGYFLQQDNPGAAPERIAALARLGHGLLFLARGQPVLYYGDEQGMVGRGGGDMQAREDMFASRAPDFRDAPLLATTRTGADDKFDPDHPFLRFFSRLAALRAAHRALRTGAMLLRPTGADELFAFSRIDRAERVELLAVFNNSRTRTLRALVPTCQPAGAAFGLLFDSRTGAGSATTVAADATGRVPLELEPLQFAVWQAATRLPAATAPLRVGLVNPAGNARLTFSEREVDGHRFPGRQEIRAEVEGGDGFAEVTFVMQRASRPGQYELLGVDDAPPYRIFWSPPPDLSPDESLTFTATASDLRGQKAADAISGIRVAPAKFPFGIPGATVPRIESSPPAEVRLADRSPASLRVVAEGTGPLDYQWLRDDGEIAGATEPEIQITLPGRYSVLVHNLAGTVRSGETVAVR